MILPVQDTWQPVVDPPAARAIGVALEGLGYTEEAVLELLGDEAYGTASDVPVHDRRLDTAPLATAIRLLFLELPVPPDAARAALGDEAVAALAATGFALVGDQLVAPRARIVPVHDLLLASDGFSHGADDPAGYVATYTPTARLCSSLTPRPQVERALDIGTGNGIQALLASRHADHVVATDLNERAVAFTALNAALNGFDNVEARVGSLYEPVEGEEFGLIVCNAPFVVSPESRFVYRDGGLPADELSEQVVRGAANLLADEGYATLLVSWVSDDPDEPDGRPEDWVAESSCDTWILGLYESDPLDHAASWNSHLKHRPAEFAAALDEWTAYMAKLGIEWITEGAVLLHRRPGDTFLVRADRVDADELESAGPQIERVFAAHRKLARIVGVGDPLLRLRMRLADDVRFEEELEAGDGTLATTDARIRLTEGAAFDLELDSELAGVLAALDGGTLADALPLRLRRRALPVVRELLELGFLEVV